MDYNEFTGFGPYEFEDSRQRHREIEIEHRSYGEPTMTAYMQYGTETVWITAYEQVRTVCEVFPPAPLPDNVLGSQRFFPAKMDVTYVDEGVHISDPFADIVMRWEEAGWRHVPPPASARSRDIGAELESYLKDEQ